MKVIRCDKCGSLIHANKRGEYHSIEIGLIIDGYKPLLTDINKELCLKCYKEWEKEGYNLKRLIK